MLAKHCLPKLTNTLRHSQKRKLQDFPPSISKHPLFTPVLWDGGNTEPVQVQQCREQQGQLRAGLAELDLAAGAAAPQASRAGTEVGHGAQSRGEKWILLHSAAPPVLRATFSWPKLSSPTVWAPHWAPGSTRGQGAEQDSQDGCTHIKHRA